MNIFLGVDGGGTKTALCLISEAGEVLAHLDAPGTYYLDAASEEGVGLVGRVLGEAVPAVCAAAGREPSEIAFAFFGLPAYGEVSADMSALDAAPRSALGHGRYRCANDMLCAWAGSLGLEDGINVVSGTGSMTYGSWGDQSVRVGGWGELFGDEGSGYWIGVRGLQAFTQMSDGRLPGGPLLDVLRERLTLDSDLAVIDVVLNRWRGDRREVASLSRTVVEAAHRGDTVAEGILAAAADQLVRLVDTTRRRLQVPPGETVPVSYSGGVFSAIEVRTAFEQRLSASTARFDLRTPRYPPVLGAALYAAWWAGTPLGPAALRRLRQTPHTSGRDSDVSGTA